MCPPSSDVGTYSFTEPQLTFVSQAVQYQAQFPINFSIPVTQVPPASAQLDLAAQGGHGTLAFGFLIAFEDANQNGVFDLGSPGVAPEHVLASSLKDDGSSTALVFLDGTLPPTAPWPQGIAPGFSFFAAQNGAVQVLAADTTLSLATAASTLVNDYACSAQAFHVEVQAEPAVGSPFSCGDILAADGTLYEKRAVTWFAVVGLTACVREITMGQRCIEPTVSLPSNWPCH